LQSAAYEECITESGKIGGIYAALAKDAFRPLERAMSLNGKGNPLLRQAERAQHRKAGFRLLRPSFVTAHGGHMLGVAHRDIHQ
jgi:hypothetical protein